MDRELQLVLELDLSPALNPHLNIALGLGRAYSFASNLGVGSTKADGYSHDRCYESHSALFDWVGSIIYGLVSYAAPVNDEGPPRTRISAGTRTSVTAAARPVLIAELAALHID